MTQQLFIGLVKWQQEGNRGVTIKLGEPFDKEGLSIFCYDYDLMTGKHIYSVSDVEALDFNKEKELKEKAEYEALKLKFENMDINEGGI